MLCEIPPVISTFISHRLATLTKALLPLWLLAGCSSSGVVSVPPAELTALQDCQANLQTQQRFLFNQLAAYERSLTTLQESVDQQRQQLAMMPPPPPVTPPKAVDCPKPPRTPPPPPADTPSLDKQIVGERERVLINAADVVLRARINTGVSLSQLDARNIQMFERNGEEWVRFTLVDRETDKAHELERRRLRYVQLSRADESSRRPVVEMRITLGKLTQTAEFLLVDRSSQVYPLLIGRNVLRDLMLVDVSRSDLAPVVREAPAGEESGNGSRP